MDIFVKHNKCWYKVVDYASGKRWLVDYYGKPSIEYRDAMQGVVEADWADLDWNDTVIMDKDSKVGWLDREGVFHGGDYHYHEMMSEIIFGKSEYELEQMGYIKISGKDGIYSAHYDWKHLNYPPSNEQLEYLLTRTDVNQRDVIYALNKGDRPNFDEWYETDPFDLSSYKRVLSQYIRCK